MTGLEIAGAVAAVAGAFVIGVQWYVLRLVDKALQDALPVLRDADKWHATLTNIAAATANINHGTARKVHRMATEALK